MRSRRGMTLIEILVSLAILAMISLIVYGAVDSLSRGKKAQALRNQRARHGRSQTTACPRRRGGRKPAR